MPLHLGTLNALTSHITSVKVEYLTLFCLCSGRGSSAWSTTQILPLQWNSYNKGNDCSCIPLLLPCLWLYGVSYVLCLLPSLLMCCKVLLYCSSVCPGLLVLQLCCCVSLSEVWASAASFIKCIFGMHSGIACLASQAPDWAVTFWEDLYGL